MTAHRLIFLLVDGLRADTAYDYLGYVQAMRQAGRAHWSTLSCELPSLSRPLYATLLNGQQPLDHGIVHNSQAGHPCGPGLFEALHRMQRRSAVAAYHWFYELLSARVFDPHLHRDSALPDLGIEGARWYWDDDYPDSHLLADAESLRQALNPDFMLVHPMGMDSAGHRHGGESLGYSRAARRLDQALSLVIPRWHRSGYQVLLTSDHGMHADHGHGGPLPQEREVPLIWLSPHTLSAPPRAWPHSQTEVPGFITDWLSHKDPPLP